MAKKQKIAIHRDEDLAAIDDELDAALGSLEETNQRIGQLLETIEAGDGELPDASPEDTGKSPDDDMQAEGSDADKGSTSSSGTSQTD